MKLNLNLNSVRYVDHEPFQRLNLEKLNHILRGFDSTKLEKRELVESVRILNLDYCGELKFFVHGELPRKVNLEIILLLACALMAYLHLSVYNRYKYITNYIIIQVYNTCIHQYYI